MNFTPLRNYFAEVLTNRFDSLEPLADAGCEELQVLAEKKLEELLKERR